MRRPLVLTGGPAVGKSTCATALATAAARAARIDADDLRQLVISGAAAAWEGPAGPDQMALAALNACALARNFEQAGFDTVIADVLTPATAAVYRREVPQCLVVHLRISLAGAQARAATRQVHLSAAEFRWLHQRDATHPPPADVVLQVDGWSVQEQVKALADVWTRPAPGVW